jgi:perosamine synthetase
MRKLAINGGVPVRTHPFPNSVTTGAEEISAAVEVLKSGLLSGFLGSPSPEFFGGPQILRLEGAWSDKFNVKHSVSCNSATSGLIMAVGALGISPGDEVIVSPYTMSATATAILFYGGIPIFCDIEPDFFCLDPQKIESKISSATKAILTTDIHGQSSNMAEILRIARKHNLLVINDCAQAPGARYRGEYVGGIGDVGIFSLNRHKNIQCGEGGIVVTNDDEIALRLKLIRNHGENVTSSTGFEPKSLANMLGFNFRMTELEAAIAYEQLKKIDALNQHRIELVHYLNERLSKISTVTLPAVRPDCTHVYYMHVMLFNQSSTAANRAEFVEAIRAEGIPIWGGYLRPLYLEPLYQKRIAIGDHGYPFNAKRSSGDLKYEKGLCPVAEQLYEYRTIINPFVYPPLKIRDSKDIADAIEKVSEALML